MSRPGADFAPSCCPLEAERPAQYFFHFLLIFLLTEFLGEFQKLFVTSFQKHLAKLWSRLSNQNTTNDTNLCAATEHCKGI